MSRSSTLRWREAEALGRYHHHDRFHDLVGQRLALAVPEREEPADVADEGIDDVGQAADEAEAAADRLTGLGADAFEPDDPHARGLARLAHLDREPDPDDDGHQSDQEAQRPAHAAEDDSDDDDDDERDGVDEIAEGPRTPAGQRALGGVGPAGGKPVGA